MDEYTESELKALSKDTSFRPIWSGGTIGGHLRIKCQVAEEGGLLIYNGRKYHRSQHGYRPPKIIRMMGRMAKESTDPMNDNPEISILTAQGKILRLDACPCGGELVMDHREVLYCAKCFAIYE